MKRKRNANPTTPPAGYVVIMISSSSCRLGTTQTCPPVYLCFLVSHAASNLTEELTGSALDLRISRLSTQQTPNVSVSGVGRVAGTPRHFTQNEAAFPHPLHTVVISQTSLFSVYVLSVANVDNKNNQSVIMYLIDDAVVANAHSPSISTS